MKRRGTQQGSSHAAAPIRALSASKPALGDRSADDPLSAAEVQEMKEHFRFLRAHRKLLKLRLNATEDLLLNGVREPAHRGVCQHLLAKVEKDRVLAVTERLPPPEAAKLLAGVLRFAPEVSYVLRYLECVSDASSRPEAAQALVHALKRIQFSETSHAQMRQILNLIVQVFPREELPVLLFNWLYNAAFRNALERSSEVLPESLRQFVIPLRSAHRALGRDAKAQLPIHGEAAAELASGLGMLLGAARASLRELPESSRRRLLDFGLRSRLVQAAELRGLAAVFTDLEWRSAPERGEMALRLVGAFLAAGDEAGARELLQDDLFEGHSATQAKRWLRLLQAPRIGSVAIAPRRQGPARRSKQLPEEGLVAATGAASADCWLLGFHVPTQTSVRVRFGSAADREQYSEQLALWRRMLVPGVVRPLTYELAADQPYVAVRLAGRSLARSAIVFERGTDVLRRACSELCLLFHAIANLGICLPDAEAKRFSVDDTGRIWFIDPWGAREAPVAQALSQHAELARALVAQLMPDLSAQSTEGARSLAELLQFLE